MTYNYSTICKQNISIIKNIIGKNYSYNGELNLIFKSNKFHYFIEILRKTINDKYEFELATFYNRSSEASINYININVENENTFNLSEQESFDFAFFHESAHLIDFQNKISKQYYNISNNNEENYMNNFLIFLSEIRNTMFEKFKKDYPSDKISRKEINEKLYSKPDYILSENISVVLQENFADLFAVYSIYKKYDKKTAINIINNIYQKRAKDEEAFFLDSLIENVANKNYMTSSAILEFSNVLFEEKNINDFEEFQKIALPICFKSVKKYILLNSLFFQEYENNIENYFFKYLIKNSNDLFTKKQDNIEFFEEVLSLISKEKELTIIYEEFNLLKNFFDNEKIYKDFLEKPIITIKNEKNEININLENVYFNHLKKLNLSEESNKKIFILLILRKTTSLFSNNLKITNIDATNKTEQLDLFNDFNYQNIKIKNDSTLFKKTITHKF